MTSRHTVASLFLLGCAHTTPEPAPAEPKAVETPFPLVSHVTGVVLPTDPAALAEGAALFERGCAPCHATGATYQHGPDLADGVWKRGNSPDAVYQVIWNGIAERGMPAYGHYLGEAKVAAVTAYVLSLSSPQ